MIPAKVLVVEDERVVALHLRQQLGRLGYAVPAICTAGAQALQQIRELRPDVVLMDIHIEGDIDGIETAARIPDEFQVPVIYLTAYSEEATLERARQTRPYGYLLKPFSERELHAAIQMVLERRRADSISQESSRRLEELVAARTEQLLAANREIERQTAERWQHSVRCTRRRKWRPSASSRAVWPTISTT
jgi:CheY-like chemotaxis protein